MFEKNVEFCYYSIMEEVSLRYLKLFEEKYNEYLQNKMYTESIEVASDIKLFRFYQKKVNKLSNFAEKFESYKKLIDENKIIEELLLSETDEANKLKLIETKENNLASANSIFEELKMNLFFMQESVFENASVEISAKTSDDSDFVQELKLMFENFAKVNNAKATVTNNDPTECKLELAGENVFSKIENLTGLYQKINGSVENFATVVILKMVEDKTNFSENDFEFEYSKSSGAGGQHINKTESAVRVIHKTTGLSVKCQDERSQLKNKERAINLLKQKIAEYYKKFSDNDIKLQRNLNKNAIFTNAPLIVFDYNKNLVQLKKLKTEYSLDKILSGELVQIANDIKV